MSLLERNRARRKCPKCNKSRIYPRTKTKDWRCSYCKRIFDFPIPKNL